MGYSTVLWDSEANDLSLTHGESTPCYMALSLIVLLLHCSCSLSRCILLAVFWAFSSVETFRELGLPSCQQNQPQWRLGPCLVYWGASAITGNKHPAPCVAACVHDRLNIKQAFFNFYFLSILPQPDCLNKQNILKVSLSVWLSTQI